MTKIDTWNTQGGLGTNGILVVPFTPTGPIDSPGGNYSFISLLFDGYLGWDFVCTSDVSSTQLFAYVPLLLAAGAGVSSTPPFFSPSASLTTFA